MMTMPLGKERGGDNDMSLPTEVTAAIAQALKDKPSSDVLSIVSTVVETLAGKDPNKLLRTIQSLGGTDEFIQAVVAEVRRLKSLNQNKA